MGAHISTPPCHDKGYLRYGNEMVKNGDFDAAVGWSLTNWSIAGSVASCSHPGGGTGSITQDLGTISSLDLYYQVLYKIEFDLNNFDAHGGTGNMALQWDGTTLFNALGESFWTEGHYSYLVAGRGSTEVCGLITSGGNNGLDVTIDNFSIKRVYLCENNVVSGDIAGA